MPASSYVTPNQPVQLTAADCDGTESTLGSCSLTIANVADGQPNVNTPTVTPAAVKCVPDEVTVNPNDPGRIISNNPITITMALVIVILVISVLVTIRYNMFLIVLTFIIH